MSNARYSPYLSGCKSTPRPQKLNKSEIFSITNERKNVSEKLHLMKVRIKQLEREEKKAKMKSLKARILTEEILERRTEKSLIAEFNKKLKILKEKEIQETRERNKEIRENNKLAIAVKTHSIREKNRIKAKIVKETTPKVNKETVSRTKTASVSHNSSPISKPETSLNLSFKIDEEKKVTFQAIREIGKLEEIEKALIERLKAAYEEQKEAEEKVVYLVNNPVICSKQDLEKPAVKK